MNYHNITKCDMLNGEGIRVVLWVSHCTHACLNCHNPQTHDEHSGINFDEKAKQELYEELAKDYVSGMTFSGGDPLSVLNRDQVLALAQEIKQQFPTKTIWLYTGYTWSQVANLSQLQCVDVLVDGLYIESRKSNKLPYVGSDNQRIIDVKQSLGQGECVLYRLNQV